MKRRVKGFREQKVKQLGEKLFHQSFAAVDPEIAPREGRGLWPGLKRRGCACKKKGFIIAETTCHPVVLITLAEGLVVRQNEVCALGESGPSYCFWN